MRAPLRILVLVEHAPLASAIERALGQGICVTRVERTVEKAQAVIPVWRAHIAIVDIGMGTGRILDALHCTANGGNRPPTIALTQQGGMSMILAAFEQGADDVLTVPFAGEELFARVLSLARRVYREAPAFAPVLRMGELEIDFLHRRVVAHGNELRLTSLELELLYLLATNAGEVLTRDQILDHVWGVDYVAESNIVDRHIHNVRAKLRHAWCDAHYIATIPGRGYRFVPAGEGDAHSPSPWRKARMADEVGNSNGARATGD